MSFRAAVVGVGHLGRHHARIWSQLPGVELVAVSDLDSTRVGEVARDCGAKPLRDYRDIPEVDAVSVAVPTVGHHEVATHFLSRGIPVLVEKPMTTTSAQAEALVPLARQKKVHLQPGFVERFNPALKAASSILKRPRFIEAIRISPLQFRSLDIGVVMDLMIHDLDIVLWLAGAPVQRVEALGVNVLTGHEDLAKVRLTFANGCQADLTASRIATKTVREIRVFQEDAYLSLDYGEKRVKVCRKKGDPPRNPILLAGLLAASGGDPKALMARYLDLQDLPIDDEEPLAAEIRSFLAVVRDGAAAVVTGEDALAALKVAERIRQEIQAASSAAAR